MALEVWIAFALVSALLLAVPGPTALLVVSYALGLGRRTAAATITGVILGQFAALSLALGLLVAVLAASPEAYAGVRLLGFAYLVLLVARIWRAPAGKGPVADNDNLPQENPLRILFHSFSVTTLRPTAVLFFLAFLPQFINPAAEVLPQAIAIEATFLALALASAIAYVIFAERARAFIRRKAVRRTVRRTGANVLIAAGSVTAGYRKIAA